MSLSHSQSESPRPRRRWYQFRLRTLFILTAVVALALGITLHFRAHVLWHLHATSMELNQVGPLPVAPMPEEPLPKGWVACRFGSLYFSVPPGLAGNARAAPNKARLLLLGESPRSMMISLPTPVEDVRDSLTTDWGMPPEGERLSPVMLRLAIFQADSNEFRWSMSPKEVRWLAWRVTAARLTRLRDEQRAETLNRDDLEGVVYFRPGRAEFDWQTKDGQACGIIHFFDRSGTGEIEPDWVRAVCRSVKSSGPCFSDGQLKDGLEAQFQTMVE